MLGLGLGFEHSVPCPQLPSHPSQGIQLPHPLLTSPFLYSGFPSIILIFWILKEKSV